MPIIKRNCISPPKPPPPAPRPSPTPSDKIQSSTVNFFQTPPEQRGGSGGIKMSNLHRAILHEDGKIKIAIRFIVLRYFTLFYYHVDLQPCQSNAVISIHCFCVTFHHQVDLHPIRSRNFGLGSRAPPRWSYHGRDARLVSSSSSWQRLENWHSRYSARSFPPSPVISRCGEIRN